jgi:hypothetical protein
MGIARFRLARGVVVEEVGDDLMVMVPGSPEILSLSGAAAEVVRKCRTGDSVTSDAVTNELTQAGVLESSALSRRGLIKAGAIGAGAGIAVLSMPGVAAASSEGCKIGAPGIYRDFGGGQEAFDWEAPDPSLTLKNSDFSNLTLSTGEVMVVSSAGGTPGIYAGVTWSGTFAGFAQGDPVTGEFDFLGDCYIVTFTKN